MWASLGAWFVRIALPLVLNWAKGLALEGIALLAKLLARKKADKAIDEKNDEAIKPIEEIIAKPRPEESDKDALKEREKAVDDAAKNILG